MNRNEWIGLLGFLALSAASGCDKKEDARPATSSSAAAVASGSLPVPEDYEGDAVKKVTAETLDSRLDALEKEIAATPK